jgi:hypothetical protein
MFFGSPFQGIKLPGRDADYSLPYSFEVNNECSYTFSAPHAFVANNGAILPFIYES